MIYPLVRELAAEKVSVAVTCRVLGFTTGLLQVAGPAYDVHRDDLAFGYRFIADALRERGLAGGRTGSRACAPISGSGRCSRRSAG
jgi:putative transposase